VACALDQLGRQLATGQAATTPAGYRALLDWAKRLGEVEAWGVEGTGCYGAGLARFLTAHDQVVLEVNRPDRSARRRRGKSDPVDAEAAARAVLAGQATVIPKTGSHLVEMVRCLRVARATAVKARTQAANALRALVVTAPAELREQLRGLPTGQLVGTAAPRADPDHWSGDQAGPAPVGPALSGPGRRVGGGGCRAGPPHRPGGTEAAAAVRGRA
jgi:transposase